MEHDTEMNIKEDEEIQDQHANFDPNEDTDNNGETDNSTNNYDPDEDQDLDRALIMTHISNTFYMSSSPFSRSTTTTTYNITDMTPPTDDNSIIDCNRVDVEQHSGTFTPAFCVDNGAPRSVIGNSILAKIESHFNITSKLTPSSLSFRFGDEIFPSMGKAKFTLITPATIPNINVELDVVPVMIPPLIGLNILDKNKLMIDNVNNKLARRRQFNKNGKIYFIED